MHIPDGFLVRPVWGAADVISGIVLAIGLRQVGKKLKEDAIPLMGVLAAFVFAAQMINLPMAGGTSAHFLGGVLLGALLGPWCGLVIITVVLMIQCFIFQDGGIAALGANVFTMGIIGSWMAAYLFKVLLSILPGSRSLFWAGFLSAWIGVVASAIACTAMLAYSGVVAWKIGLSVIVGVHAVFGLIEGVVTGTVLESLKLRRPDLLNRPRL